MPEMHFVIRWPDGQEVSCYSPSLVVKDYLVPGASYGLAEFLDRSRISLGIASQRVQAKFGVPCTRALGQLRDIEARAADFARFPNPRVTCIAFIE